MSKTISQLEADCAGMLAPDDLPGTWTARERDAYETQRALHLARLNTARLARGVLDEWEVQVAADLADVVVMDGVVLKRLGDALLSLGKPKTDYERGVQQNLRLSLMVLHHGLDHAKDSGFSYETLQLSHEMLEAGLLWRGSLTALRARVRDGQGRVTNARQRWEWATMDDDERVAREAESAARAAAHRALTKVERTALNEEQHRAYMATR